MVSDSIQHEEMKTMAHLSRTISANAPPTMPTMTPSPSPPKWPSASHTAFHLCIRYPDCGNKMFNVSMLWFLCLFFRRVRYYLQRPPEIMCQSGWCQCWLWVHCVGYAWGVLRDKTPKITRAEAMARAELASDIIYKWRATLKGNYPLKPGLWPWALLCLLTPSLNFPCYSVEWCHMRLFGVPDGQTPFIPFFFIHCAKVKDQIYGMFIEIDQVVHTGINSKRTLRTQYLKFPLLSIFLRRDNNDP